MHFPWFLVLCAGVDLCSHVCEKTPSGPEEDPDARIAQGVFDVTSLRSSAHESAFAEATEMIAGVGLRKAGGRDDLADRLGSFLQRQQDREAAAICETSEELGLQLDGVRKLKHQHIMIR